MATSSPPHAFGDQETAFGVAVPGLPEYTNAHRVQGMPSPGHLDLQRDCTRLILYNVQSHTTTQIWDELNMCLGLLAQGVVKIKRVSGLNRNPHADVWVRKDLGSSLLACIRDRTTTRMNKWGTLAAKAHREERAASHSNVKEEEISVDWPMELSPPPRDEGRSVRVQGWRLALWQPWRERQMKPTKPLTIRPSRHPPMAVATYNLNGFWSKLTELSELLDKED